MSITKLVFIFYLVLLLEESSSFVKHIEPFVGGYILIFTYFSVDSDSIASMMDVGTSSLVFFLLCLTATGNLLSLALGIIG